VGPRAGLDVCENLASTGIRSPNRTARSQSLYRLNYPAHIAPMIEKLNLIWSACGMNSERQNPNFSQGSPSV
jgi:hypothetical protein